MKVNILDAHDRLLVYKKQSDYISKGCQDCINSRPAEFGSLPFYIFAHKRRLETDERVAIYNEDWQQAILNPLSERKYRSIEDVPTDRLIWQPRLCKPKAQENSMLFKYHPSTDTINVIWMIPAKELWGQFKKGNMTENKTVVESIYAFEHDRRRLEAKEEDDLNDEQINAIYREIGRNVRNEPFRMV